jgi:tetratricopeptide (TPR) repeat protein
MNWRHTLISSAITLLVTLVAGLLVYYLTRQPPPLPPAEKIVYRVNTSATFGKDPEKITFLTIRVENIGNKAAHNVRIVDAFPNVYEIQNKQIEISSGVASNLIDDFSQHKIDIVAPNLVPNEYISVSLLVKGPSGLTPSINVRSDDSVGTEAPTSLQAFAPEQDKTDHRKSVISTALASIIFLGSMFYFVLRFGGASSWSGGLSAASRNNVAFVYIRQGLIDEARQILSAVISESGGDPITLANLGVTLGLHGDTEAAQKLLSGAEWWAGSTQWINRHAKAVLAYDRATLLVHYGDIAGAMEQLKKAFSMSRRQIRRYCNLSIYIKKREKLMRNFVT